MSRISFTKIGLVILLVLSNVLVGFPADFVIQHFNDSNIVDNLYHTMKDKDVVDNGRKSLPTLTQKASAANFTMQTGYYVGNGGTQTVSGVGFQPQFVIIKPDTSAGTAIFKTSAMPANTTSVFGATAVATSTLITFTADGFSVAANASTNNANVRYTWTAFAGSDCTASGTFCVGTYTGNGTNPRLITTGFQPSFALVKRSTAVGANFRTNSMAASMGQYFTTTAQDTGGALFTTLVSNGFNVGASINNVNTGVYYYVAFKSVTGVMAEGTYTGNGTDNRSITGFGASATPNFAFVKNATSATTANRSPYMSFEHTYGDYAGRMDAAAANAVNMIQRLQTDGIQVGSGVGTNENTFTHYWVAFGGAAAMPGGSGTFQMATGTYTGNGTAQSITSAGFQPDLVIIKDNAANHSVFKTSLMSGDNTAYLAAATANFTTGITAITASGFDVGASTVVNTTGNTYHWQAFGNAYEPQTRSGAADFMVGNYTGNGIDSRDILAPWQPDMVTLKRNSTTAGTWRSTANSGDSSSFFAATAEGANRVQALQTSGYQVGTTAEVNTAGSSYNWFGFKTGTNFAVNSYTGTTAGQTITTPGFEPDLVWAKRSTTTATAAMMRPDTIADTNSQYFSNTANATGKITAMACLGFTLGGAQNEVNANTIAYRYAAWRKPDSGTLGVDMVDASGCPVTSPSMAMATVPASFDCDTPTGTLGIAAQKIRVTNTTANPNWSLSIAATSGANAVWTNGSANYDFNDPSGSPGGCADGADVDSGEAGQLTLNPSVGTLTPKSGCDNTGVNLGASSAFSQGVINAITLATGSSAGTNCYWDITGINASQKVPEGQPAGNYTLNLTVTVTAN